MLKRISQMKSRHQILFAIIIGFAVISFWRGVWGLMDIYLFPESIELSLWLSVIIGIAILVAAHCATRELM